MDKHCCNCRYFDAYYTKAYICFLRTDCGHCFERQQAVGKKDFCEKWGYRRTDHKKKKNAIIEGLSTAITSINAIKLILDEENRPD